MLPNYEINYDVPQQNAQLPSLLKLLVNFFHCSETSTSVYYPEATTQSKIHYSAGSVTKCRMLSLTGRCLAPARSRSPSSPG